MTRVSDLYDVSFQEVTGLLILRKAFAKNVLCYVTERITDCLNSLVSLHCFQSSIASSME